MVTDSGSLTMRSWLNPPEFACSCYGFMMMQEVKIEDEEKMPCSLHDRQESANYHNQIVCLFHTPYVLTYVASFHHKIWFFILFYHGSKNRSLSVKSCNGENAKKIWAPRLMIWAASAALISAIWLTYHETTKDCYGEKTVVVRCRKVFSQV